MEIGTQFKLANFMYWVVLLLTLGYFFQADHWTKWVALILAAFADQSKTNNIRAWERYNIHQAEKENK